MRRLPKAEPYNFVREGCFGTFSIGENQNQLFYVQTNFRTPELANLVTARDALQAKDLRFEEMIQREINESHVDGIVDYLKRKGTVRFFPPLLAALVRVDAGRIADEYPEVTESVTEVDGSQLLSLTWGELAQLQLALGTNEQLTSQVDIEYSLGATTKRRTVVSYLSALKLNMNVGRLVVVDGQHRLRAIQKLFEIEAEQASLRDLLVPVTIFFPPQAAASGGPSVKDTLRKLFVDVNKGAKSVSGHFLVLLNDTDLGALAVRSFCEDLKTQGQLWLAEWSEHEEKFAYQLNTEYSITGVGVLHNAITDSGFEKRRIQEFFPWLLGISDIAADLDTVAGPGSSLKLADWQSSFPASQRRILAEQIGKTFVPALREIYSNFSPFSELRDLALKGIRTAENDAPLTKAVEQFLQGTAPPNESVAAGFEKITSQIRDVISAGDETNPLFRTQRFQQGLLAAFYEVCALFHTTGVSPTAIAKALVLFLNTSRTVGRSELFGVGTAPWLEGVVTKGIGQGIIALKRTRVSIARLLIAPAGDPAKAKLLIDALNLPQKERSIQLERLTELGRSYGFQYWAAFQETRITRLLASIDFADDINDDQRRELQSLKKAFESANGDDEAESTRSALERKAAEIAGPQVTRTQRGLERVLGYSLKAKVAAARRDEE